MRSAQIFEIGDAAVQVSEPCVELFHPHEDPQQRLGDRIERYLVILDVAVGMRKMVRGRAVSAFPLPIVTIRHPDPLANFAGEGRCGRPADQPTRRLKPCGPELARVVSPGYNRDTSWRYPHKSLILR
jgi:hypothetical protein